MSFFKKLIYCVLGCAFFAINLSGQVEFNHTPPQNYQINQSINITSDIIDDIVTLSKVEILYRITGDENFQIVQMIQSDNNYSIEVPAEFATEKGLEYAIVYTLMDNTKLTFPAINALENPYELLPIKNDFGTPILLTPDNNSYHDSKLKEILIAISMFNIIGEINNISLKINDVELVDKAQVFDELITLQYTNFQIGQQKIIFSYKDQNNIKQNFFWNFTIESGRKIRKNRYTGNVNVSASSEKLKDYQQNIFNFTTNTNGNIGKTNFNSKIYMTSRENKNQQPVDRFNLNFRNSILNISFGDVHPSFSNLSLYGNRIRGIESKLSLGFFNFQTVWGYSKRDILGKITTIPDTLDDNLLFNRTKYSFSQKVFGLKPSFDFGQHANFGLFFLKVKDDTSSVSKGINGINISEIVDISMPTKPQESINLGMDLKINLNNNRLIWESEIALSELNKNIYGGALTLEELDTYFSTDSLKDDTISINEDTKIAISDIPFDPEKFENIFTINPFIEPLLPIVPDSSGSIGFNEFWNMPGLSLLSKLRLNYFKNYIIIKYKKIGTQYNSLVNPYLQKDFREFQIQDRIRFFQDRIITKIGYTNRINNYSLEKKGQYIRNSVNIGFSYYSFNFLPNFDFSTYFDIRKNNINTIDTLFISDDEYQLSDGRKKMASSRYNLSMTKDFLVFDLWSRLQLNYSYYNNLDKIDNRLEDFSFPEYNNQITRLVYSLNFMKKSKLNFEVSNNVSEYDNNKTTIFGFGSNFQFLENREKYRCYAKYNFSKATGIYKFQNNKISSGINYKLFDSHTLDFYLKYSWFQDQLNDQNYSNFHINFSWYYFFK